MTKKQSNTIAKTLNDFYKSQPTIYNFGHNYVVFHTMLNELMIVFKEINDQFDKEKFLNAVFKG